MVVLGCIRIFKLSLIMFMIKKIDTAALRPDEVLDDYIPTTADELDAIGQG